MRGMFTCGVLDVLLDNNIEFDGAVGTSAGATFGCNYKSKQKGRALRYNLDYCKDWRYGSWKSFFKTGDLYNAEFCYDTIPNELDPFDVETYQANPMEFYCTCTDCVTGQPFHYKVEKGEGKDLEYIRASASIPIVSRLVEVDGHVLSDGGTVDPISLEFFQSIGYEKNVVVLTQPESYRKEPQKYMGPIKLLLKDYPALVMRLENRYALYNNVVRYIHAEEKRGNVFVIQPQEALDIGSMEDDPEQLKRVYQMGRQEAERQLEALKTFLKD